MMSKFKEMKFWIGDDQELSKGVQFILFGLGYTWISGDREFIKYPDVGGIVTDDLGRFYRLGHKIEFDNANIEWININWMSKPDRKTYSSGGKEYYEDDVDALIAASSKIKEVS